MLEKIEKLVFYNRDESKHCKELFLQIPFIAKHEFPHLNGIVFLSDTLSCTCYLSANLDQQMLNYVLIIIPL